ncbi:hypothetical protein EDB89DRAFT_2082914 [Lactarius sanguifluus]|nr:hypothetical protein EDB89DRAFT_2082914 [Lactarius sanguifluus]
MTNFQDPEVVKADGLAFMKVLYVVGGIYIWEFFTSLWFEWQIITGRRSYRWSIWLYSGCRLSALFAIITIFVGFNVTTPINCRAWLVLVFFFAYSAFVFASALIVLRIVAIWERNWLVCTIAIAAWLVNIAFYIRNMTWSEAVWSAEQSTCLVIKTDRNLTTIVVTLAEDIVLLVLMLAGLRRYGDVGMYGLWRFLHRQGLLWLVLVTVAEIPTTVFIILNLNGTAFPFVRLRDLICTFSVQIDYFNLMFQTPELIMMAVGASRIYRSLADYSSMTDFNWEDERFWTFHGAAFTSHPPTVDGIQLSQHAVGEPQPSATIVETFDAASPTITKTVHKVHSFTSTVVDSPV